MEIWQDLRQLAKRQDSPPEDSSCMLIGQHTGSGGSSGSPRLFLSCPRQRPYISLQDSQDQFPSERNLSKRQLCLHVSILQYWDMSKGEPYNAPSETPNSTFISVHSRSPGHVCSVLLCTSKMAKPTKPTIHSPKLMTSNVIVMGGVRRAQQGISCIRTNLTIV
jgi:hypothetical protein